MSAKAGVVLLCFIFLVFNIFLYFDRTRRWSVDPITVIPRTCHAPQLRFLFFNLACISSSVIINQLELHDRTKGNM